MRVQLIEDEHDLGGAVAEQLAADGHAVDWVSRADDAQAALSGVDYRLVLLDLGLPDGDGLDLLRQLRREGAKTPVIVLTARDQIRDRIAGLNAGADDYLVKPFDLGEMAARVRAVARRSVGEPSPWFSYGAMTVDRSAREVRLDDRPVFLTGREWSLLALLVERPRTTVSRSQLEAALYQFGAEVESNVVEVYVSRLRKKLGAAIIRTVRGIDYRLGD